MLQQKDIEGWCSLGRCKMHTNSSDTGSEKAIGLKVLLLKKRGGTFTNHLYIKFPKTSYGILNYN